MDQANAISPSDTRAKTAESAKRDDCAITLLKTLRETLGSIAGQCHTREVEADKALELLVEAVNSYVGQLHTGTGIYVIPLPEGISINSLTDLAVRFQRSGWITNYAYNTYVPEAETVTALVLLDPVLNRPF